MFDPLGVKCPFATSSTGFTDGREFLHFEARALLPIGKGSCEAIFFPFINIPG